MTKSPRRIAKIEKIVGENKQEIIDTKTEDTSQEIPEMYIINFADNRGYVVTSGDKRASPVFLLTPLKGI